MAISDLLWACPECGEDGGLAPEGRDYRCKRCGTTYRRGKGAAIEARHPDGSRTVRRPVEWLNRLPDPQDIINQHDRADDLIRSAKVAARWMAGTDTVHGESGYLNRIEVWGEETPGILRLRPDRLVYDPEDRDPVRWPFASLRAVQASSSTIQINGLDLPLVSFRFPDDSIFLWEQLLHAVLRDFYGRTGRGKILEFQPRIVTV